MSKLFELIHGSKNRRIELEEAYSRFVHQNDRENILYVVINGIAMPVAYKS